MDTVDTFMLQQCNMYSNYSTHLCIFVYNLATVQRHCLKKQLSAFNEIAFNQAMSFHRTHLFPHCKSVRKGMQMALASPQRLAELSEPHSTNGEWAHGHLRSRLKAHSHLTTIHLYWLIPQCFLPHYWRLKRVLKYVRWMTVGYFATSRSATPNCHGHKQSKHQQV